MRDLVRGGVSLRSGSRFILIAIAIAVFASMRVSAQTCTAPDPADRPSPAQQYFMIIVDSSGSMTTQVTQGGVPVFPSCGGYPSDRFGHARCAVRNTIANFSDRADFGLAQFATIATNVTNPCFGNPIVNCYPSELSTTGLCSGCGPKPGDATTRAGARIVVPITTDSALLQSYVDNSCLNPELGPPLGNTPLNGALRDMKRYFSSGWTEPNGAHSFPTPLATNTLFCRRVNVILITDGDETCDTLNDARAAAFDLFQNGVTVNGHNYKVRTYVINFAGGDIGQTDQIAAAGGTGVSLFATNDAQLNQALNKVLARPPEALNGLDDDCNGCIDDNLSQLSLTKTASQSSQSRNGTFSYTITGNNAGPTFADAKLVDTLPSSLTLTSFSGPPDWTCTTPSAGTTGTIQCTNPLWGLNTPATFTVGVQVSGTAVSGPLTNTATLTANFGASPPVSSSVSTTVTENQPPVANAGPNQSLAAGASCSVDAQLDGRASTDPDGDPLTFTWSRPGFGDLTGATQTVTLAPGSYDFTLTVDDGQGGTSSAVVNILVTDTIAPTIAAPPDVMVDSLTGTCSAPAALGTPLASDNCGTPAITRSPAGDVFPVGTTNVTWTATDAAGNAATAVQKVTVIDLTPPAISAPAPMTFQTGPDATSCALLITDQQLSNATATDDCPDPVTITRSGVPQGNLFPVGTTTITYTATDAAGNHSSATTTVTVADTTPPVISAPASLSLATGPNATGCGLAVPDSDLGSATATDNCPGVQVSRSGVPSGNFFPVGTTTITHTATDAAGNIATATQTVTIADNTPPVLTLSGNNPMTLSCGAPFHDPGATALDNCDGDRTSSITTSGTVDATTPGPYTVNYSVADGSGNTSTAQRTVVVLDAAPPVITVPAPMTFQTGPDATSCALVISDQQLSTATATDDCSGPVTITRSGVPQGNVFPVGTTTITYTATDAAGHHSSATTTVTVADTTRPAISAPASLSLATGPNATGCGLAVPDSVLGTATAGDNCPGAQVSRSGVPSGNFFPVGTTTITHTATDAAGNTATAMQTVTIADNTPPALTLSGNNPMTLSCRAPFHDPGATALDNCDGDRTSSITTTGTVDATTPGTYTVNYSVADGSGNTSTAQRTVVVLDDAPPVINSASVTPNKLWPPNHKMVPVSVSASASDVCSGTATCSILSVSSNEPVNGLGDGDQAPDWQISGMTLMLRAERSGKGTGRIYTITIRCVDGAGQSTDKKLTVTVPHDN